MNKNGTQKIQVTIVRYGCAEVCCETFKKALDCGLFQNSKRFCFLKEKFFFFLAHQALRKKSYRLISVRKVKKS